MTAACFGLFGDGLLSKKHLTAGNSTIVYDKFHRRDARMEMKIDINSPGVASAIVAFPNEYMESFRIESVYPEPNQTNISGDHQSYIFKGSEHMKIIFELIPKRIGRSGGTLKVNSDEFVLNHFIYP